MTKARGLISAMFAVALVTSAAFAHSSKEATVPTDGAILETPPESIEMTLDSPMRVTMVRLTDSTGTGMDLQRSDDMAPVTQFKAVPATLGKGAYTVEWRGLSGDGHPMQGSFSFEIAD
ncbi:copper resistance protein CopC [Lutimaribacter marinistellae]|uniref:Copper resistance protein CopC n=1 Tax=Lutimaribacter marinistellae TaxID=1820329 RepID=A0ABV7TBP4_9RHOB